MKNNCTLASYRSDRHAAPKMHTVRILSNDDCRLLSRGQRVNALDQRGKIGEVKITSIKTWKRQPDRLEIHWKFGLYEYGVETLNSDHANTFFCEVLK